MLTIKTVCLRFKLYSLYLYIYILDFYIDTYRFLLNFERFLKCKSREKEILKIDLVYLFVSSPKLLVIFNDF